MKKLTLAVVAILAAVSVFGFGSPKGAQASCLPGHCGCPVGSWQGVNTTPIGTGTLTYVLHVDVVNVTGTINCDAAVHFFWYDNNSDQLDNAQSLATTELEYNGVNPTYKQSIDAFSVIANNQTTGTLYPYSGDLIFPWSSSLWISNPGSSGNFICYVSGCSHEEHLPYVYISLP